METFLGFYFWYMAVVMGLQAIVICVREYPHTTTKSVGQDVFVFILMAFFFIWIMFIRIGVIQ